MIPDDNLFYNIRPAARTTGLTLSIMALPAIATGRLILRPFGAGDVDALHAIWADPDVRRYLWDDVAIPRDRAVEEVRAAMDTAALHGIGYWTLRETPAGPLIGDCGFRFFGSTADIELMCGLLRPFWGRGLAAEAVRAALQYLWQSTAFPRVHGQADLPNERSVRLMERLGMRYQCAGEKLVMYVLDRPENVAVRVME